MTNGKGLFEGLLFNKLDVIYDSTAIAVIPMTYLLKVKPILKQTSPNLKKEEKRETLC